MPVVCKVRLWRVWSIYWWPIRIVFEPQFTVLHQIITYDTHPTNKKKLSLPLSITKNKKRTSGESVLLFALQIQLFLSNMIAWTMEYSK